MGNHPKSLVMNQSNSTLQLISALIVLLPVAIIFIKQKGSNRYFLSLAAANMMFFISTSLLNNYVALPEKTSVWISMLANVLQAPLTLIFLLYFTENNKITKGIKNSLAAILGISVVAIGITSFNEQTTLSLMTLGTIPVFLFGSVLFIQHVKSSVYHQKGTNKAFILSAIVFAYGSYMLLLTLNVISPEKHSSDIRSLFGLITIISAAFASISIAMFDLNQAEGEVSKEPAPQRKNAAIAQWDDFSLSNTPELSKTSVTNISKYYPSYQNN